MKQQFAKSERKGNDIMKQKAVKCIETGKNYISISEAAREIGIKPNTLVNHIRGRQSAANGYHFEYLNEEETREFLDSITTKEIVIQRKAIIRGKGKSYNGNSNAVLCVTTGDVYTSCTDAAHHAGVTQAHMSHVCRGNGYAAKGKRYCYVKDINEHLDEVATSIRKANMYDEFMTKDEKRKELVARIEYCDNMLEYNDKTIVKLLQEKQELQESRENAIRELMNFGF